MHPEPTINQVSQPNPEEDITKCEVYLILHHPRTSQLLLRTGAHRFQLPCLVTKPQAPRFYFQNTCQFLPEVQQYFGFDFHMTMLRCMWHKRYNKRDLEDDRFRAIVVIECHGQTIEPPTGTKWMDYSCALFPQAAIHDANDVIEQFTCECRTGIQPTLRPSFARRGWYESTIQWMESQLSSHGFHPIVHVTQLNCSYRGTVLKAETSDGTTVYLKCSPHFINEAAVCKHLADLLPNFVGAPIATDIERRLVLMRDHGVFELPLLFNHAEEDQWASELAEIHQSTIGKEDVLLNAGLRLLTLDTMEIELGNVLEYAEQTQLLNGQIVQHFRTTLSEVIRRHCREVQKCGIPSTFVHGDLYFSNVYRHHSSGEVSHGIADFGESTISHPFIDAIACFGPPYCENWERLLAKDCPHIAPGLTKKKLLDLRWLCVELFPLWEGVGSSRIPYATGHTC